jgi:formate dehydrogenase maturation protein FdhE
VRITASTDRERREKATAKRHAVLDKAEREHAKKTPLLLGQAEWSDPAGEPASGTPSISVRWPTAESQVQGADTMIEMDGLLVTCPQCGAWPMSASFPKGGSTRQEVRFKCIQCQHVTGGQLRRSLTARPASEHAQA